MSDLETGAKPVISALVNGRAVAFDAAGARVVSAWAVKTAMVLEHALPRESGIYYTQEEREAFAAPPHVPPDETFVDVGWYPHGALLAGFRGSPIGSTTVTGRGWAPSRRCSLIIGQLALRVESNRWKETMGSEAFIWPDKLWGKAVHVWPLDFGGPQEFPPSEFLADDEARNAW